MVLAASAPTELDTCETDDVTSSQPPHSARSDATASRSSVAWEEVRAWASDRDLVDDLVAGSQSAWASFVARYAPLIRWRVAAVARASGGPSDPAQLDDLTAEVFAALLSNDCAALRGYAGRSSLATYLGVIAARVAIRKSIDRNKSIPAADSPVEAIDRERNPLELVSQGEQAERLHASICKLPPRQQQLVSMYYLQGKTYEQISRETGIPIGSIGPTLARAQQRLRQDLGD
ncbi:MAG: sigma-70 family RNA polymerase sigma factor [Planctomycetota bacterium]|nr:MAG: sigma-70 family RNA polymerase sigma factor [Planctomycetota bacterium]